MLLDLVSPWTAAVEANDSAGLATFRERHSTLLELLRREHTPHTRHLPLVIDQERLSVAHRRVIEPTFQQLLESTQQRAADLGADAAARIVLLPLDASAVAVTAIPQREPVVVIGHLGGDMTDTMITILLARALARLTRWMAPNSESAVRRRKGEWDRWELARALPLREWIYTEGVAWHLAHALHPETPLHTLFDIGASAWQRLREQEPGARAQLAEELDERGVGLVMRWLMPSVATAPRRLDGQQMPPQMGQYLAWRMTAPRVARVGISAAIRAEA